MTEVRMQHNATLEHHVTQGQAWLEASAAGANSAALSYAALELRYAIERLAVHYWVGLLDRKMEAEDLQEIGSFKRIERRIYDLGGHQQVINRHFEFMHVVLGAMKIDHLLRTPQIGDLARYWHECSELCHIGWPLSCSAPEVRAKAFEKLTQIAQSLSDNVGSLGWPVLKDGVFAELRDRFVAGTCTADDVLAHIRGKGIWARAEFTDGRPAEFVGAAIPPTHETPRGT